jgi:4-aminobutyrate aminotransferase-like enzyme
MNSNEMSSLGMINGYAPDDALRLPAATEALIGRRAAVLGSSYRLFYEEPVHFVRGEGVWLYDADGAAYLDVYNNVASLGHAQPDVVAAVSRQSATLNTHTRYLDETILDYAEALLETLPDALGRVIFTCTGSEANDLAYRVARSHTGATGVIVTALAYHGVTDAVSQFSPSLGANVPLGAHVRTVAAPDAYHAPDVDVGKRLAADVRSAIDDMARHGIKPAMMICDTIFSSDGIFSHPPGFLRDAVEAVRDAGGLFVADEVQPGFGRTGEAMWGFERHGIVPDIVTAGKPMGNGQPIAGLFARPEIVDAFGHKARYFNTFGGNPVSCAAGRAVLQVIQRDGLIENARMVGDYLRQELRRLAQEDDRLGDIRGVGLFTGAEMVVSGGNRRPDGDLALRLVNDLRRNKVLISASGPAANVLKIRPPIIFGTDHVDHFISVFDNVLKGSR